MIAEVLSHRARLFSTCLVLVACVVAQQEARAEEGPYRPVLLDQGIMRQHDWAVAVMREDGRYGGQRPCLLIVTGPRSRHGEDGFKGYSKTCSALPLGGRPNIVSVTTGEDAEVSIFGVAFRPRVRSVYLDFGPDGSLRVRLKQLNDRQMQIAGVRPIRYAAFALRGDRCLQQVIGYGKAGGEIYRGPIDQCPEHAE